MGLNFAGVELKEGSQELDSLAKGVLGLCQQGTFWVSVDLLGVLGFLLCLGVVNLFDGGCLRLGLSLAELAEGLLALFLAETLCKTTNPPKTSAALK